jgi:hypothetical protein
MLDHRDAARADSLVTSAPARAFRAVVRPEDSGFFPARDT